ncbi:MAG TPA: PEP-CTERM sorting domain-containing protein [Pirellulales bacterium]|jgi:hypothetical protein
MPKSLKNALAFSLAACLCWTVAVAPSRAGALGFGAPEAGLAYQSYGNDGFVFTPSVNIMVTALDYYLSPFAPENGTALVDSHPVGIYSTSNPNALLTSAMVGPGSGPIVNGGAGYSSFVPQAITPIELLAGQSYMLSGTSTLSENENGGLYYNAGIPLGNLVPGPEITVNAYFYDYNLSLDYPTTPYATGFVGPNFQYTIVPSPVPEPTSGALLLIGTGVVASRLLKRKRDAKR